MVRSAPVNRQKVISLAMVSIPRWFDQHPQTSDAMLSPIRVSIPRWFDQHFRARSIDKDRKPSFNSTMVRSAHTDPFGNRHTWGEFQFHDGSISTLARLAGRGWHPAVSIPRWFDQHRVAFGQRGFQFVVSIPRWFDQHTFPACVMRD